MWWWILTIIFWIINYSIIGLHERKYKKNFPYTPYKSKKNVTSRIGLGLLAGLHYFFFIGTYNHKKYNTQVDTPKTLECYFGNVSQLIISIMYFYLSYIFYLKIGLYYLIFLSIPIITNIISLIYEKFQGNNNLHKSKKIKRSKKKKTKNIGKNILMIFLYLILLILGGSIIWDITSLIFKDSVNDTLYKVINLVLIFIFVILLSRTKVGKEIDNIILMRKNK